MSPPTDSNTLARSDHIRNPIPNVPNPENYAPSSARRTEIAPKMPPLQESVPECPQSHEPPVATILTELDATRSPSRLDLDIVDAEMDSVDADLSMSDGLLARIIRRGLEAELPVAATLASLDAAQSPSPPDLNNEETSEQANTLNGLPVKVVRHGAVSADFSYVPVYPKVNLEQKKTPVPTAEEVRRQKVNERRNKWKARYYQTDNPKYWHGI